MAVAAARHPAATPPGRRAARPANGVTPPGSTPQRPLLEVLEELQPPGDPAGYEYMAEIGCGSEGNVLSARQVGQAHAQLAIKVVRLSSPAIRKHVCQELQIGLGVLREEREGDEDVTGLRYLVSFHDWYPGVGGVDREVHMVLERCEFQLDEMLRTVQDARATYERQRRMSASMPVRINPFLHRFAEAEVVCVLLHVLRALAVLNGRRVIHRDVKAENILWQSNRDGHQDFRGFGHGSYKLCDFGVARRFAEGTPMVCAEKVVVGTLWTIAPEVLCMESYGPNCDIWSLGCVLWEMMFLDKPFHSSELLALQTGKVQNPWASLTPGAKVDSARHLRSRCVYDARLVSVVADLCLQRPSRRPDATALLRHPLVHELAELHGYCGPPLPGPDPWDPASPTSTGTPRGSCSPARDCARRFSKGSLRVRATGESPGRSGRRGSGPLSPKGCESPSARGRRGSNPLSPKASSKSASPARSLRGRRSLTGIHVAPPTDTAASSPAPALPSAGARREPRAAPRPAMRPSESTVQVPARRVGALLGVGGEALKALELRTGTAIALQPRAEGSTTRSLHIQGKSRQHVAQAEQAIKAALAVPRSEKKARAVVSVPASQVSYVIGKSGRTVRAIEEESGASVKVVQEKGQPAEVVLTGLADAVALAQEMVQAVLPVVARLEIPGRRAGALIGFQGEGIRELEQESGATIRVTRTAGSTLRDVVVEGSSQAVVDRAVRLIEESVAS